MTESPARRLLPAAASLPTAAACLPWLVSRAGAYHHHPSECNAAAPIWPDIASASDAPPVGGCSLRGLLRIQPRLLGQRLRPRLSESVANYHAASPRRVLCRGCETGTACHS